jgi:ankyrin repeat protein
MGWPFSKKEVVVSGKQNQLNNAIDRLDSTALRMALTAGADPNGGDDAEISPLVSISTHAQAWLSNKRQQQHEMILILLDAGARPDWGGKDGQSPFEIALKQGWLEIISKMLEKGQDPNRISQGSPTPLQSLMLITDYRSWPILPVVQCLLSAGAEASRSTKQQPPPLALGLANSSLRSAPDMELALCALVAAGGVLPDQAQSWAAMAASNNWNALASSIQAKAQTP